MDCLSPLNLLAQESTVHGVRYFIDGENAVHKFAWVVIMVCSVRYQNQKGKLFKMMAKETYFVNFAWVISITNLSQQRSFGHIFFVCYTEILFHGEIRSTFSNQQLQIFFTDWISGLSDPRRMEVSIVGMQYS